MSRLTLSLAATALIWSAPIDAQGWIEPRPGIPVGDAVVKLRTSVSVRVLGRVATVEVEEWFENRGGRMGEGDYIYPLPGEAVFDNFSLFQGDEELRGETMDADQARAIYEEIVRRKRDPALIELVGHGMVRARVFPINAGERRKITLRYTQVLPRAGQALQLRYAAGGPTTSTQRTNPTPVSAPITLVVDIVDGDRFDDPFSPTHRVIVRRDRDTIRVRTPEGLRGNFALFLPLASDVAGLTMAAHRVSDAEDGYFMLTVSPGRSDGDVLPRDVTAVVDVSGSMSGTKMSQAKAALRQLLGTLNDGDRFRLIAFSNRVRSSRSGWSPVTDEALTQAREWVDALQADGGTNIDGALSEAFRVNSPDDRLAIVVFLTDGLPSVGEQDPETIAARAAAERGRARVFAFGVGYDVNTFLLDQLTSQGRGSTAYVEPTEDVEQALSTLAAKIGHPVLTDLRIDAPGFHFSHLYPEELPDLFAGEELLLFGRYGESHGGRITLTGRRGNRNVTLTAQVELPNERRADGFIPRLWASRRLGYLTRTLRLEGRTPELVEEIRNTALQYGLLSEFTSYLVQEPSMVAASPLPMPDDPRMSQQRSAANAPMRVVGGRHDQLAGAGGAKASGETAVRMAEESRQRREVRSAVDLDEFEDSVAAPMEAGVRRVGGRLFDLKGATWTDRLHIDSLPVTRIAPFSEAYFRLLRLAPELERWLGEFDAVLIAGTRASILIDEHGSESLHGADLARLVREFRGR